MITIHPDEKVLAIKRKFWLPIALEGAGLFLLTFAPFFLLLITNFLPQSTQNIVNQFDLHYLFFATAWLLVIWVVFFILWTDYYLDIFIVTDHRLIDIEQIGLFGRDVAELRLERIQDIKVEIIGFLPTILRFGNLHVQSAGEGEEIVVKNILHPETVKDLISRQCDELSKTQTISQPPGNKI
jgi:uncharacterized membrane protein YdbT with pleckstrin-like domain